MPNVTLSVTEETKKRMERHPEVRWSKAVRTVIEKKLRDFEGAERIASKSRLTEKDIELVSKKAARDAAKRAKGLLDEGNG